MDTPHPIDRIVGQRLRMRRRAMGYSQAQLATELGLTFQQVQKYEHGVNRISASKLWLAAKSLEVQVSYFFADSGADHGVESSALEMAATPEGERLATLFPKLDRRLRRRIVALVEALHEQD